MRDCQSKSISMKLLAFKEKLCSEINKSPKKWKLNEWTSIKVVCQKKKKWKLHHSQSGIILRCLQKFVIHLEANSIAMSWPRRRLCRILLEKKGFLLRIFVVEYSCTYDLSAVRYQELTDLLNVQYMVIVHCQNHLDIFPRAPPAFIFSRLIKIMCH